MNITLNRNSLALIGMTVWAFFVLLYLSGKNPLQLENIFGILTLAVLPGMYTFLAIRIKGIPLFAAVATSVAFSLFELMATALIGNYLLPLLGNTTPLSPPVFLTEVSLLFFVTLLVAYIRLPDWTLSLREGLLEVYPHQIDFWTSLLPLIFVVQAIAGAFSLNNGGSNLWTIMLLAEVGAYLAYLTLYAKRLNEHTIATAISFIGLALLLMTSMRGWNITGHDIQREFQVFMLAKQSGIWSMAAYRDAYNACLSITILPTLFSELLRISDVYIFKLLFQVFFAFVPGIVYLLNRNWVSKEYAIVATVYFFCFPTFFLDMPFLVRQEIAFLFYGLMLYFLFEKHNDIRLRRALFVLLGGGVVLSHYSTTYTVIVVMLLTVVAYPLFMRMFIRRLDKGLSRNSALAISVPHDFAHKERRLTLWMVVTLAATSFLWTSIVTGTGHSVTRVVGETFLAIRDGFTENSRSVDVVNLISFTSASQQEQLDDYIDETVLPLRAKAERGTYYATSSYEGYAFVALPDERLPRTRLSSFLDLFGIKAERVSAFTGQLVSKFMEIMAPFGLLYVFYRRRALAYLNSEVYLLAASAFVFVAMNIILPVLSTEYGIYRALLQSLFIIGFLIVIATTAFGNAVANIPNRFHSYMMMQPTTEKKERIGFSLVIALLFFFYGSGLLPQLFGANPPLLHLNNSGRYYDTYLMRAPGNASVAWLTRYVRDLPAASSSPRIAIDHSSINQFTAVGSGLELADGIFPGLIEQNAYVYVSEPTFARGRSTLRFGGDQVVYSYPISFLDENKNLLYDNGSTRVYR